MNTEREIKEKIGNVLQGIYKNQFEMKQEESLEFEDSFDIPEVKLVKEKELNEQEKEDYETEEKYDVKKIICENNEILIEYKRRAMEFWKPDITMKPKSLNIVKHKFQKVTLLRQLRRWKEQVNSESRMDKLKFYHTHCKNSKKV